MHTLHFKYKEELLPKKLPLKHIWNVINSRRTSEKKKNQEKENL